MAICPRSFLSSCQFRTSRQLKTVALSTYADNPGIKMTLVIDIIDDVWNSWERPYVTNKYNLPVEIVDYLEHRQPIHERGQW